MARAVADHGFQALPVQASSRCVALSVDCRKPYFATQ